MVILPLQLSQSFITPTHFDLIGFPILCPSPAHLASCPVQISSRISHGLYPWIWFLHYLLSFHHDTVPWGWPPNSWTLQPRIGYVHPFAISYSKAPCGSVCHTRCLSSHLHTSLHHSLSMTNFQWPWPLVYLSPHPKSPRRLLWAGPFLCFLYMFSRCLYSPNVP